MNITKQTNSNGGMTITATVDGLDLATGTAPQHASVIVINEITRLVQCIAQQKLLLIEQHQRLGVIA